MTLKKFKAAITAASFPMSYSKASRSVLYPDADVTGRVGAGFTGGSDSYDYNVIQLLYCENALPTAKGMAAVGYFLEFLPAVPPTEAFDKVLILRDSFNNNVAFSPAAGGNYIFDDITHSWISYSPFVFAPPLQNVTIGYVNGRTLIFYESTKCLEYDPGIPDLVTRTLILPTGFTLADIRGNGAASNYHLLFTEVDILWSTITDVLDFDNPAAGSGRQIPNDLKGKITAVLAISGGFLIYTTENVVSAAFTNNSASPFAFREVANSAGVESSEQVTGEANAVGHYTYGAAGIQNVTMQRAESIYPEAADFLVGRTCELWDPGTKEVGQRPLSLTLTPKLRYLGSRYLFISYGESEAAGYSQLLVVDTVLGRWGKLVIPHVDIAAIPGNSISSDLRYFQLTEEYDFYDMAYEDLVTAGSSIDLRQNYGFIQADGSMYLMVMGLDLDVPHGLVIFGHIQVSRRRQVTILAADFDGVSAEPVPIVTILGTERGQLRDSAIAMDLATDYSDTTLSYASRYTCLNADLALEGNFDLSNLQAEANAHGTR